MKVVILAWWNWSRLWPISRPQFPKQFNKLDSLWWNSLFQLSLKRALHLVNLDNIFIVVSNENYFHAEIQAEEIWVNIQKDKFIFQPSVRDTLPIISLAVKKVWDNQDILFLPSDHVIEWLDDFKSRVDLWLREIDKWIIVFWIKPTSPMTCYGYIKKSDNKSMFSKVDCFHEKPDLENAKKYIKDWFFWNAWIFLFNSSVFIDSLKKVDEEIKKIIFDSKLSDEQKFEEIDPISIDKWLIEKIDNIYCIGLDNYWSDLGSFDSISNYSQEKWIKTWNVVLQWNSKNNFVVTESKLKEVCLIDVDDLVVVDSEDVLLISKKWSTNKVKNLVKQTKKLVWNKWYRPWGSYHIITPWRWFQTKKIIVLPWKRTSLQSHNHRSEHWVVAEWTLKVTIWETDKLLMKWQSIYVPMWEIHRIANPWLIPLVIIETQIWDYLWEDDINRFEDDFGRT